MRPPSRGRSRADRRALTHAGGPVRKTGDPDVAALLARAARPPQDQDPRALTHGFHAWPARMHPFTARALIAASPVGPIVDPFMGGGTVMVEATLAGRRSLGGDINPVALEVAWARTRAWAPVRLRALPEAARELVQRARELRARQEVDLAVRAAEGPWFDPPALAEVWSLAEVLRREGDEVVGRMLRACLSSILVKASHQVSDSVPRKDEEHRWVPKGRVEAWFVARAEEQARNLAAFDAALPEVAFEPRLWRGDARHPPRQAEGIAAIVTSPPYPGVYDYAAHHERRYAILNLDARQARQAEVGARRDLRRHGARSATERYVADMTAVLAAWASRMLRRGRIWLVVGDGQSPEGPIPSVPLIIRAARAADLRVVATVSQRRPVFGPGGARSRHAKEEHLLALETP